MALATIYRYAQMRGVDPRAIRTAIAAGSIVPDANGRVSVEQADADWHEAHKARLNGSKRAEAQVGQLMRAKVTQGATKAELLRLRLNEARAAHVERQVVREEIGVEGSAILAVLRAVPEREAPELAKTLGIAPEMAVVVLSRVMAAVFAELGELAELTRMVDAA